MLVETVIEAPVTVSPSGRLMVPSTKFWRSLPSRMTMSTLAFPSPKVVTFAEAKGARSISNIRKMGFVFGCVSFDMVSPAPLRGFHPLKSRRLSVSPLALHGGGPSGEHEL